MILVDTSVWVDHLRRGDPQLARSLEEGVVLMHPFVLGEVACGTLSHRSSVLDLLGNLPTAAIAEANEVLGFIERQMLFGRGIGYVDVHLLASVALTEDASLWTRDRRLYIVAESMGIAFRGSSSH